MPKWTADQSMAIKETLQSVLVCAGAGSGKTAVLTERIAQLVSQGVPIKKMLVVTYTKAAAAEMKRRVAQRLEEMLYDQDDEKNHTVQENAAHKEMIKNQIDDISIANISTMHSFCGNVLRRHFHEIDVDPSFRVADEYEILPLQSEAVEEVFDQEYAKQDKAFIDLLDGFQSRDGDLQKVALAIYNQIMGMENPWEFLEVCVADYELDRQQMVDSKSAQEYFDFARRDMQAAADQLKKALALVPEDSSFQKYREGIADHLSQVEQSVNRLKEREPGAFTDIQNIKAATIRWPKGMPDEELKAQINSFRDEAKKTTKAYKNNFICDFERQVTVLHEMRPAVEKLVSLVKNFHEAFSRKKAEKSIVNFTDLEHLTLKALKNEVVRKEYQDEFQFVFIDEYQDCNAVQESIVTSCARSNNLFCVGDVKQSIYKFRLADPQIFVKRYHQYRQKQGGRLILLNKNFRSCSNVIHAVNDIFAKVMSREGELEYLENDYLLAGREFPDEQRQPEITVKIINKKEQSVDSLQSETNAQREAVLVAQEILSRVDKPLFDVKLNDFRPAKFSDFAVLMRSTAGAAEVFTRIFSSKGIPSYSELSGGYFSAIEVQALINLLRIVDNSEQDVALLSALRAGISNIQDEDMMLIRKNFPELSFYAALENQARESNHENEECKQSSLKCAEFLNFLDRAKQGARTLSVERLLETLIDQTNYMAIVSALPFGRQRAANIDMLLERARDFESTSTRGLGGFIDQIDSLTAAGKDMGEARLVSEGANCVRIMTIHKSKGLEFPIVIMTMLGKKFNYQDAQKNIMIHKELGLGIKYFNAEERIKDDTLFTKAMALRVKRETRAEELRLLYVGMTRAMEKLILVGSVDKIENGFERWRGSSAGSMLDYIMQALFEYSTTADQAMNAWSLSNAELNQENSVPPKAVWEILKGQLQNSGEAGLTISKKEAQDWFESAKLSDYSCWSETFQWRYNHSDTPSKISVSQIKNYQRLEFNDRPAFIQEKKLSGGEIGDAVHKVLQHIELAQAPDLETIRQCALALKDSEMITQEQFAQINLAAIEKFLLSPIGVRMREGKKLMREAHFTLLKPANELLETYSKDHISVQGVLDACFLESDDQWVLLDYKTDYVGEITPASLAREREMHQTQVNLYAEALEKLTGKAVKEKYIILLSANYALRIQ